MGTDETQMEENEKKKIKFEVIVGKREENSKGVLEATGGKKRLKRH